MNSMELQLILTSVAFFVGYVSYCLIKFGITKSISITYYYLNDKIKPLFTAVLTGTALPLAFIGNHTYFYLAAALITIVGVAADFKKTPNPNDVEIAYWMHMLGAYIGITMGILGLGLVFSQWLLVGIAGSIIIGLFITQPKAYIWWIEVIGYLTILLGMILK